jgi:hypothetical protein
MQYQLTWRYESRRDAGELSKYKNALPIATQKPALIQFAVCTASRVPTPKKRRNIVKLIPSLSFLISTSVRCSRNSDIMRLCTKSRLKACEAGGSIKPGRKPQVKSTTDFQARECGRQNECEKCQRFAAQ